VNFRRKVFRSGTLTGVAANVGIWRVVVTNPEGSTRHTFDYRVFTDTVGDGLSDGRGRPGEKNGVTSEAEGSRHERSYQPLIATALRITAFEKAGGNPEIHEVTRQMIEAHLRSLRAGDGVTPAKRQSWNTHRNELSQFFAWAMVEDLSTNRPWCFANPVKKVRKFTAQQVAEQRPEKSTTSTDDLRHFFSFLMRYRGGRFVKTFALAYFAGIRPSKDDSELTKLAANEADFINLRTGQIFISYHVALHRSIGDAALQAGNSESMVRKHYLNLHTKEEGAVFFSIIPDLAARKATLSPHAAQTTTGALKAV
jgi:hypothetical protein